MYYYGEHFSRTATFESERGVGLANQLMTNYRLFSPTINERLSTDPRHHLIASAKFNTIQEDARE
jgi:hypothetical protein